MSILGRQRASARWLFYPRPGVGGGKPPEPKPISIINETRTPPYAFLKRGPTAFAFRP